MFLPLQLAPLPPRLISSIRARLLRDSFFISAIPLISLILGWAAQR